jgi:phage shock protein PspC (stress-responsive transcriptional regulator)
MKKTLTVNLNGRVFNIDEDAYQLLDNYLRNLRIYFRNEEGQAEILADFEARIEELFSDRVRLGYSVIDIEQVEKVIAQMGRPDDFGGNEKEEQNERREKNEKGKTPYITVKKKLYRNPDDKMFAGLCSGLAAYFDWDVLAVRIIVIVLAFFTSLGIVPVYLVAWLIIPEAKTAQQKLEMQGKPITVENIGKTVAAEAEEPLNTKNEGCLASIVNFTVAFFKVCLIGLGLIIGIPLLFSLVIIVIVLIATVLGVGTGFLAGFPIPWTEETHLLVTHPALATVSLCFILGIPLLVLAYSIVSYLFKFKPIHKGVKWAGLIAWIVALILFACSGFKFNGENFRSSLRVWNSNSKFYESTLKGNGIMADRIDSLSMSFVNFIKLSDNLIADIQIEQINTGKTSVSISGDSNLIDRIEIKEEENANLVLSTIDNYHLNPTTPIIIRLRTPDLHGIKVGTIGNINFPGAFKTDHFSVEMEGAGKLRADSLYSNELTVKTEGVGAVTLAGATQKATLELDGAGEINALNLISDSVYARVDGVGSIKCNPIQYLSGNVNGVGKITYKTEPQTKDGGVFGVGKIGLD